MSLHIKAEWAWAEGTTGNSINVAFWPFVISMYSINEKFPLHIAIPCKVWHDVWIDVCIWGLVFQTQ